MAAKIIPATSAKSGLRLRCVLPLILTSTPHYINAYLYYTRLEIKTEALCLLTFRQFCAIIKNVVNFVPRKY